MNLVKTANEIHASDIEDLFNNKLAVLKIPNYFSTDKAQQAAEHLIQNHAIHRWYLDSSQEVITDMSYLLGIPRQVAHRSKQATQLYHKASETFLSDLDQAFSNGSSPLRKLLENLKSLYPHFLIEDFEGKPGLPAILRYMSPDTSIGADVWREGVCHVDSPPERKLLSVNLYLNTPPEGGELKVWDLPLEEKNIQKALYRLIRHHAFDPNFRNKIQFFLPRPQVVQVATGDLIIFDTSAPHAVTGFREGSRLSLQTFLKRAGQSIILLS